MGYLAVAFLVVACAAVLVGWRNIRHRRREVIGSAIIYQADKNWYGAQL